ncbi:MAG: hypothetical protein V4507_15185 [Verrucomicrobiota bacterium]
MKRRWIYLVCFLVIVQGVYLLGCPACRDASTQSANGDMAAIQTGFSWSVLFLMAMPMSLISAFVVWVIKLEKERNNSK